MYISVSLFVTTKLKARFSASARTLVVLDRSRWVKKYQCNNECEEHTHFYEFCCWPLRLCTASIKLSIIAFPAACSTQNALGYYRLITAAIILLLLKPASLVRLHAAVGLISSLQVGALVLYIPSRLNLRTWYIGHSTGPAHI